MFVTLAILTLAADNAPAWWMFSGQMIFNVIVGLAMFWLKRKTDETDKLRDAVNDRDATIRTTTQEVVAQQMQTMVDAIKRIEKRLEQGEQRFNDLNQHDHQAELALAQEVHQLREYILSNCATKTSQESLGKQVAALREDLVRLSSTKGAA